MSRVARFTLWCTSEYHYSCFQKCLKLSGELQTVTDCSLDVHPHCDISTPCASLLSGLSLVSSCCDSAQVNTLTRVFCIDTGCSPLSS